MNRRVTGFNGPSDHTVLLRFGTIVRGCMIPRLDGPAASVLLAWATSALSHCNDLSTTCLICDHPLGRSVRSANKLGSLAFLYGVQCLSPSPCAPLQYRL
jgi:hypothetical protein